MTAPKKNPKRNINAELDEDLLDDGEKDVVEETTQDIVRSVDDITSIYEIEDEDADVDMTKMDQSLLKNRRWKLIIAASIIGLVVLCAAVWAIFFRNGAGQGDVQLAIKVDNKVASGDVVDVEITYTNNKTVALSTAELEVFYPRGFTVQSTSIEPNTSDSKSFSLKNIAPGTAGKVKIVGQLVGTKEDVKEFSAQFTYKPENFSQDFQVQAKASTTITASIVELEVTAPEQVRSDEEFEYIAKFKNTGNVDLENVKVLIEYPEGFEFKSASKENSARNDEWKYENLAAGAEEELKIKGLLKGDSGEKKTITFQLGIAEIDNSFNVQTEHTTDILLVNPNFDMTLNMPERLLPGDDVEIKAVLKNTTGTEVKNVTPRLKLSGDLFEDSEKTFDTVKEMAVDAEQTFTYTTKLKKVSGTKQVELKVEFIVDKVTISGKEITLDKKTDKVVRVSAKPTLSAIGRYYDENLKKVGSGPLPPKVGQETTYRIYWTLKAANNPLSEAQMQATLPNNVTWKNVVSGDVTYNEQTRAVTLKIGNVAAGVGSKATFDVSITPAASDKNALMVLVNETLFTAKDAYTSEALSTKLDRITSELSEDEGAKGKGEVK